MGFMGPKDSSAALPADVINDIIDISMYIGGVKVNYYIHCKTQLWLFSHQVTFEHSSEDVIIGKVLEQQAYIRMRLKNVQIDSIIALDFVYRDKELVVVDVKKSSKFKIAHYYQVLYYIWYLKKIKGIENVRGEIRYPTEKKIVQVDLDSEKMREIEEIIEEIKKIISLSQPPKPKRMPYCKSCAYFEFCWV